MRKLLISLLLAGAAATPALAAPHNRSDSQQAQQDRQSARADARAERQADRQSAREDRVQVREESRGGGANFNRPSFNQPAPQAEVRQQMFNGGGERFNGRPDRGNFAGRPDVNRDYVAPGPRMVTAPGETARERLGDMRDERVQQRDQRIQQRDVRQSQRMVREADPRMVSNVPRPGTQPPLRTDNYRRGGDVHWNRNWQHDGHHDWRRYRDHHRSLFHLGFYIDPFGWGYQPFSIGWRMWPAYYGNQYWIDPGMYGLPYPPVGAVWVRYFNDALLIDTYTGTVIDSIPGFFW